MDELRRSSRNRPLRSRSSRSETPPARARAASRASRGGQGGGGKSGIWRFFNWKWLVLVLMTSGLLIIGGCSALKAYASTVNWDDMKNQDTASTLYDQKGQEVMKLGEADKEYVTYEQMTKVNPDLPKAFVKVEDVRFYKHHGVDWFGLGRAVVKNIITLRKGEGGGTITMQVARNIILKNREKTYSRKLKEMATAMAIEDQFNKNRILEAYLNNIYFGNGIKGVAMAAKVYFGKDITKVKLEPEEIALLAGLPKAPEGYNPIYHADKALKRRNIVLMKMAEDENLPPIIQPSEVDKYKQKPLGVNTAKFKEYKKKTKQYDAYKEYVIRELKERYDISETELATENYKIYTGLNPKAQEAVEKAVKDDRLYQGHKELDAGATMVNPKNGLIEAIAGGRFYKPTFRIRSIDPHQPGSSIKPITVYAPAIDLNDDINEYAMIPDEPVSYGGWTPENYEKKYYGLVPMRDVVAESMNAATVWILDKKVGLEKALKYGRKAGLSLKERDKGWSPLALGGLTDGVTTVEMAQAYSALNNNGVMNEAHAVEKVLSADGEVVEPEKEVKKNVRVYSKKAAWYTTRMLLSVVSGEGVTHGNTGKFAKLDNGQPVAGKTGTTQNGKDAWFVGYTPKHVLAVTIFNPPKGEQVELTGGKYPAKMFKAIMEDTMESNNERITAFEPPPGVPEPTPPFQLMAVSVSAQYDQASHAVHLSWNAQNDPRAKYRVERSEDQVNWQPLGEVQGGSFTDTSIQVPQAGGDGGLIGGPTTTPQPKTYFYRVVAIDTKTNQELPSNVATVQVTPDQPQTPPPDQGNPQGNPQGNDQGNQQGNPQGNDQGQGPGGFLGGPDGQDGTNAGGPGGTDQGTTGGTDQGGADQGNDTGTDQGGQGGNGGNGGNDGRNGGDGGFIG
ncbi:transglycosylase domain-containing protein [Polycladomyces sp. WAk]|uniref:Transglycosylase domain-containing protein n=1 Tax=Polycladomyces zharkentensis TaxID=2807616 RepID=A0ABS2WN86_9BACL|nr:transglycosylase domain-containing protein [Polycladomyces sp. WAk]MBN2911005.1 transglycosylase domain-containing protein [Polycladomyces sp. WAk]